MVESAEALLHGDESHGRADVPSVYARQVGVVVEVPQLYEEGLHTMVRVLGGVVLLCREKEASVDYGMGCGPTQCSRPPFCCAHTRGVEIKALCARVVACLSLKALHV